jgi:hypothetical protein
MNVGDSQMQVVLVTGQPEPEIALRAQVCCGGGPVRIWVTLRSKGSLLRKLEDLRDSVRG